MPRHVTSTAAIDIAATPAEVFAVVRDGQNRPGWMPELEVTDAPARPLAAGDRVRGRSVAFGHRVPGLSDVLAVEDGRVLEEDVIVGVRLRITWSFTSAGGATRCTQAIDVAGPTGPLGPVLRWVLSVRVRLLQRRTLARLRKQVEHGRESVEPR